MPIYEYKCNECEHVFEDWQSGFEEKEQKCPLCQGKSYRIMSNTSFVLKGTGWYVTDYAGQKSSGSSDDSATKAAVKNDDAVKPATGTDKPVKSKEKSATGTAKAAAS